MTPLRLNADLSQRCVVDSHQLPWQVSPSLLVHRRSGGGAMVTPAAAPSPKGDLFA